MSRKTGFIFFTTSIILSFSLLQVLAQTSTAGASQQNKTIITAVPFLTITPDARAAGMGDAGVATSADANSSFWNAAKMCWNEKKIGVGMSYTPWLRSLGVNDIFLFNGSGYYKFTKEDALALSFTYFSLGSITFTDNTGGKILDFNPNEYNIAGNYSRKLSENFSLGVAGRFIHSNLSGSISNSQSLSNSSGRPANTASVDIGAFYTREIALGGTPATLNFGANIANMGPKVSYSDNNRRDFIPTNLRIGTSLTTELDQYNKMTFTIDANKLLVPTPEYDSSGALVSTQNTGIFEGMVNSLYKAPGGSSEKLSEIIISSGVEYWYDNTLAVRGGYFHESPNKGNRRYFTAGVGARYQQFGLDFAYLIPVQTNNPLSDTFRFTLLFDFDKGGKEESVKE